MANSNFQFLQKEFPILYNIGQSAEYHLHTDPVTSLIKLRQWCEKLVETLFNEHNLDFPTENKLHVRLKTLEYENIIPYAVKDLLHTIRHKGNVAAHDIKGTTEDAKGMLFAAFKVAKWFYQTYAVSVTDLSDVKFHVPEKIDAGATLEALEKQYKELELKFEALLKERDTNGLPIEKQNQIKERSAKAASNIEMTEAQTRDLIDEQLQVAGWEADTKKLNFKHHKTLPQRGRNMAIAEWPAGGKWADYALFIGTELYAIVEAKKWASDISGDLQQAKTYAQLVTTDKAASLLGEWESYRVPFLFSTNGRPYLEQIKTKSGIWFLDVRNAYNHARPLQGWYSPEGLKKLWLQDTPAAVEKLKAEPLDFLESPSGLGLRKYQINAIRAVEKTLTDTPEQRRMLLAMATGTGKTRTIIGLCYRLIQSNRFRRILFLVDRRMLAEQAIGSFTDNKVVDLNTFKDIYDIKGLAHQVPDIDTRLHFATVQSMVKRLFYADDDKPGDIPSVDWYDCIIIDEAHRGYLLDREVDEDDLSFKDQNDYVSMYRRVLDYFDAVSIGLTATPALQTTRIFGKAIYTYSYREAVIDGFLIDHEPPFIIKTHLSEQGIVWEKGDKPKVLDKENNLIEELGELDDELKIEIAGFNRQVITENFNRTVIQQLVQEIDPEGDEKTLVFAASDEHADMVVRLFKEAFNDIGIDVPNRSDLTYLTSNKQLNFLQHIYRSLKTNGKARAAVVLPDNVLFEDGDGQRIRRDLMDKCNLHTILRLPTGIFYAAGVKTNVLFFTRGTTDSGNTRQVWFYDMRTNMPAFGKRTPFTRDAFASFVTAYTGGLPMAEVRDRYDGTIDHARRATVTDERWQCLTREQIAQKNDSLDLGLIADASLTSADQLAEPLDIAQQAMYELKAMMHELNLMMEELK